MWQVFRTYNASITLDALLNKDSTATTVDEKKAEYDRANKEVSSPLSQHTYLWHPTAWSVPISLDRVLLSAVLRANQRRLWHLTPDVSDRSHWPADDSTRVAAPTVRFHWTAIFQWDDTELL